MRRGIIVEKNKKSVTLLTPDGQFLKTKNDRHNGEIGEEIMFPSETRMGRRASFFDILGLRPFKMGIFTMTAIMLFIFMMLPVFSNNKAYAYMTIDINPSFEMALNSEYEVIELTPLNDEGKRIVSDINDWEKSDFKQVIDAIITDCSEQGYVKESKEILISTVYENTKDDTYKSGVKKQLSDVTNKYKKTYHMESLESDLDTREKAKKEGMSTGTYIRQNEKKNNKEKTDEDSNNGDQNDTENEKESVNEGDNPQTDQENSQKEDNEQLNESDSGEQKEESTDQDDQKNDKDTNVNESEEKTNAEKDGETEQTPTQDPQDKGKDEEYKGKHDSREYKNGKRERGEHDSSYHRNYNSSDRRNPNGYRNGSESNQNENSPRIPGEYAN
ncbi:anti-sigma factor domain-containing protein [Bacillus atrophaeus]|uniref:anti-sigma factor domain-containing protein n=1 Tax=Bacillus atrophaeus TaxID=1452 RepID=UPI00227ED379|nr:anti-sigma factor domain-containing protein [Bacillus atrophaeus]MCY8838136.1 anti-sigma factor domain-containing protein [Bacillus atrophaeus]MEC5219485.1 anti-sigma factor domain-containing protein [Bacillus atrophaeus]MED4579135.1 anti-sigma factor domain-containing protein [Bacillus atrophaeus]MED4720282.1 anti-sigma factor domain-containing protein [Bacillus atrophaeus]MED4847751.1 anti-sigma factor domain-containing protein [Bacillus atrophaeus]